MKFEGFILLLSKLECLKVVASKALNLTLVINKHVAFTRYLRTSITTYRLQPDLWTGLFFSGYYVDFHFSTIGMLLKWTH